MAQGGVDVGVDVMPCSYGHTGTRIVRDGVQRMGGREKQRWRCTSPEGEHHRFLGPLSRTRTVDGTCEECENHLHAHQGPQAPAEFEYLVKEIASALVDLGRGATYTDAAKRVRAQANYGKTAKYREVINGQTVADWMADFVPVVSKRWAPSKWPAVLVLDSISFRWTDNSTTPKSNLMLYSVLAAFGYDKDGKNGRLWKLEASPSGDAASWADFLGSLPGKPESIVCDQDKAIAGGIELHWGQWAAVNLVHHCEFHLSARATSRMNSDKLDPKDPARQLFHGALKSRERWDAFEAEVRGRPKLLNTNSWLDLNATRLRVQTHSRENIPPVYSNSAVEQPLRDFRSALESRVYSFRNRGRLNNLLELMRLAHQKVDRVSGYSTDIRTYLEAQNGRPKRAYREAYDPQFDDAGTQQFNSLWGIPAQVAIREAQAQRAAAREQARASYHRDGGESTGA